MNTLLIILSIILFSNTEIETKNYDMVEVIQTNTSVNEALFLSEGTFDISISLDPSDNQFKMSWLSNEEREQCFRCELPGSDCSLYPKTCFPGTSWPGEN